MVGAELSAKGTLLKIAFPSALVVIGLPYSLPDASVLINVAPTIGVPSCVPSSVTCKVRVPLASIVKS